MVSVNKLVVTSWKRLKTNPLTKTIYILLVICLTSFSCGQSGVGKDNQTNADCGVIESKHVDTNKLIPKSASEINGHKLFMQHCRECHAPIDIRPENGNGLHGVFDRFPKTPDNYFKAFIQDSDSLKKNGDPYANKLDKEADVDYEHDFKKTLSNQDIKNISDYLKLASEKDK